MTKTYLPPNYSENINIESDDSERNINKQINYGAIKTIQRQNLSNSNDEVAIAPEIYHSQASTSNGSMLDQMKSTLSFVQKFGFGLGHVYNDLCAGLWFSYTLLFMQAALLIPAPEAGSLVMLGQISDAVSTPIVGLLADRYGTKRKWHVFGTALVFFTFPMIFSLCPWCKAGLHWWPPIYFSIFIILFQFAWAIVQISHLSMIPEMSMTTRDRADLTATRYTASVCSNVIVYIITWAVLQGHDKLETNIGPNDAYRFRDISLILTLIGITMSVLFHFSLSLSNYEKRRRLSSTLHNPSPTHIKRRNASDVSDDDEQQQQHQDASESNHLIRNISDTESITDKQHRKNFFKSPLLYINAFLYVFSRLFMTTSLVYMPLWLDERSWHPKAEPSPNITNNDADIGVDHLATVPLVSFLSSFIASLILKHLNHWIGHELAYLIGSIISIFGCSWIAVGRYTITSSIKLFAIAVLFGAGSSITMISSLCITADMIGRHTYQGGFIYSTVTFADKFITGIAVVIIESLKCKKRQDCPEYYKNVLAYGCGIASLLGLFTLFVLKFFKKANMKRIR